MGTGAYYAPHIPDLFPDKAIWKLKFALWPRRCKLSNKRIWLTYGYKDTATFYYRGAADTETRWHSKDEHIIYQLKRNYGN